MRGTATDGAKLYRPPRTWRGGGADTPIAGIAPITARARERSIAVAAPAPRDVVVPTLAIGRTAPEGLWPLDRTHRTHEQAGFAARPDAGHGRRCRSRCWRFHRRGRGGLHRFGFGCGYTSGLGLGLRLGRWFFRLSNRLRQRGHRRRSCWLRRQGQHRHLSRRTFLNDFFPWLHRFFVHPGHGLLGSQRPPGCHGLALAHGQEVINACTSQQKQGHHDSDGPALATAADTGAARRRPPAALLALGLFHHRGGHQGAAAVVTELQPRSGQLSTLGTRRGRWTIYSR